jgi:regulator of sigma E protease
VGEIEPGSPAARDGLLPGDEIVSVDGVGGGAQQISEQLGEHVCAKNPGNGEPADGCRASTPAEVVVNRGGRELALSIRPAYDAELDRMRLGFAYAFRDANLSVPEASEWALDRMWYVTEKTVGVLARIFDAEQRDQISGVVGSYEVTRQSIEFDARQAVGILGVISLSLAVINLFPFLPLDGGHIFWALVEKLRGRPVSFRTMERAGIVGFVLVLMLFVIGLQNDIGRLTGEGFDVR